MGRSASAEPDWRDAEDYAPLLAADRTLIAWEWLRRDPGYRAAARSDSCEEACRFGLAAFEPPDLPVPDARPIWRSDSCRSVLLADVAADLGPGERFDPRRLGDLVRTLASGHATQVLLSDGLRCIRLDVMQARLAGPVTLSYRLQGLASVEAGLRTLERFLFLCRRGDFSPALHRPELRARRWILELRAQDALAAGADQRTIAAELFGSTVLKPAWRTREPSVRSRVQRLVRSARRMSAGAWRQLLR